MNFAAADIPEKSESHPSSIDLGFDFYGAGNIGDDLMLAGFLQALSRLNKHHKLQLRGRTVGDLESQKKRFPEVQWRRSSSDDQPARGPGSCWAGVGDTPFQLTAGDWFLNFLLSELSHVTESGLKVMIGVGAEKEIGQRSEDFSKVALSMDRIFTRDEHSSRVLLEMLSFPEERLFTGADLANISLARAAAELPTERQFSLGIIVAGDTLSGSDLKAVRKFIMGQRERVAFVANEVRMDPQFERDIFRRFTRFPSLGARSRMSLLVPPYQDGTLLDLVRPVWKCDTLVSSRYHGLLAGAWAGSKLAAIGRSSKVSALAQLLEIPCAVPPLTSDRLTSLRDEAVPVSTAILRQFEQKALEGVRFALE